MGSQSLIFNRIRALHSSQSQITMKLIFLAWVTALAQARPQELASPEEVELIPAVSSEVEGEGNGEGPVVVVISGGLPGLPRLPGIGSFFDNVPGFSDFPFQNNAPRIPSLFGPGGLGGLGGLDRVFGGEADSAEDEEDQAQCGPLCLMFRALEGIQGEIDDIHTQMNGGGSTIFNGGGNPFFDGDFDVNNSTYEEKELEDGTKVKINRTVLADTDGNGNQFFFHSSVVHNFGDNQADDGEAAEEEPVVEEELPVEEEEETETEMIADIPESDPSLNEINDEKQSEEFPTADVFEIDDGLEE